MAFDEDTINFAVASQRPLDSGRVADSACVSPFGALSHSHN
jgi:hypothetical protein